MVAVELPKKEHQYAIIPNAFHVILGSRCSFKTYFEKFDKS